MLTVMELIEILKEQDPLAPVFLERNDMELGFHFKPIAGVKENVVKSMNLGSIDAFDGSYHTTRVFKSCAIEKPNAFKIAVIK